MEDRRVELEAKLKSLVANRDELIQLQLQQLNVTSCSMPHPSSLSTSAFVDQLIISVVEDTIDTVRSLLELTDDCSELQDKMLILLDLVSALLLRTPTSANSADPAFLLRSSTATLGSTRTSCDVVVAFLITSCVAVIWLVEIWSAVLLVDFN